MRLLVSGCTTTVRRLMAERPDRVGVLVVPGAGNRVWWSDGEAGCDNGCFGGLDAPAFLRMLAKVKASGVRHLWVTAPDVVGDAVETRRRFDVWEPMLRELGLSVAFVGQDGLIEDMVPWDRMDAFFVGGSTAWKLSDDAMRFTLAAHDRGKLVHVGRVNSRRRILYLGRARRDGRGWCDTLDGGSAAQWGETNIPKLVRWIDESLTCRQRVMFGGNA